MVRHKMKLSKILCHNRLKTKKMDDKQQNDFYNVFVVPLCVLLIIHYIYTHF